MPKMSNILTRTIAETVSGAHSPTKTGRMFLRLVRAGQPISRIEIAERLNVHRSLVTEAFKPLIVAGVMREEQIQPHKNGVRSQGRPRMGLRFSNDEDIFAGVYLGVRGIQYGLTTLSGEILAEEEFATPADPQTALAELSKGLRAMRGKFAERNLRVVGVSVPGVVDAERRKLVYAPHLDWKNVAIADILQENSLGTETRVVVENDAAASAVYEASLRLKKTTEGLLRDFVLVRSGTGLGVGLVIDGEVYRGTGKSEGIAGEFGHMTIVAGGKTCSCGNRGCWERYAAASAASSLYVGDRMQLGGTKPPRFVEIVERAEAGEIRAVRTLEKIGEYLGIGIGNVITGLGVSHVILSGRIVLGWKFYSESLKKAVGNSLAGRLSAWSVEPGEPHGGGLGGAYEVAVEEFLTYGFNHLM
jgi:N-acetylglucosamine repressor